MHDTTLFITYIKVSFTGVEAK